MHDIIARDGLRAVAYDSVAELSAAAWDRLADGTFYTGHGWSTYQERDARTQSWAVAVLDGDELVAASTLHLVEEESSSAYDLPQLLGCDERPVRTLLCGNRRGYDNRVLAAPDRDDAVALLVEALTLEAQRVNADFAWWPYLDDAGVETLRQHVPADDPWLLQLTAEFQLPDGGFEEFLAGITRQQRADIRRDRRRFAASGRAIHHATATPADLPRVAELVTNVESKYGSSTDAEVIQGLLAAQVDDIGEEASLISCADAAGTVACSLAYRSSKELAVRVAGLDYDHVGEGGEYFETVYYQPIELAYEIGLSTVSVGFGSLRAKRHRGASLAPRWAVPLVDPSRYAPTPAVDHTAAKLAELEATEQVSREVCTSELLHSLVPEAPALA